MTVLIFLRALREDDFQFYIESLTKIVPWLFALDHTHYSRWLPVHLRDIVSLKDCQCIKMKFVVKKSKHAFSAIAIDQAHLQNNACIKGEGRAVGLT